MFIFCVSVFLFFIYIYKVKPVYKGQSRELENVPFIYRLRLHEYALFIDRQSETALYRL